MKNALSLRGPYPSLHQDLPYRPDSATLFARIAGRAWSVFLDSARPHSGLGRFDILAADPYVTLVTRGASTSIRTRDGSVRHVAADPFDLVRKALGANAPRIPDLPFAGGALGYFGYDLGRRVERLEEHALSESKLPDMAVGIYDWALVVDHERRTCRLVSNGRDAATARRWDRLVERFTVDPPGQESGAFQVLGKIESNLDAERYARAFACIQAYIRDGDCYQVNLARRFAVPAQGDAWALYRRLRAVNPAPYSAFLRLPWGSVLSNSPERFLHVCDRRVETRPIKGTRPRHSDPQTDAALARELAASEKDRAENLMIVDLLRNDLGRNCVPGSVCVPELFAIESFARVHHLVSSVCGQLRPERDALDLLRGCFPGGSITGAPKVRAMQIIEELEPCRRSVYCGAIGYVGHDGAMDTNIAIRTLVHDAGVLRFWAGGGIVADSQAAAEFQETLDKVAAVLELLESEALQTLRD